MRYVEVREVNSYKIRDHLWNLWLDNNRDKFTIDNFRRLEEIENNN